MTYFYSSIIAAEMVKDAQQRGLVLEMILEQLYLTQQGEYIKFRLPNPMISVPYTPQIVPNSLRE